MASLRLVATRIGVVLLAVAGAPTGAQPPPPEATPTSPRMGFGARAPRREGVAEPRIRELTSLPCDDVVRLTGLRDFAFDLGTTAEATVCGQNAAAGFVCAIPPEFATLSDTGERLFGSLAQASLRAPCDRAETPLASQVCGGAQVYAAGVRQTATCVMQTLDRLRATNPGGIRLNPTVCRTFGAEAFSIALDASTRNGTTLSRRIAELLKDVFAVAADVNQLERTVLQVCGGSFTLADPGASYAPPTGLALFAGTGRTGEELPAAESMAALPRGFTAASIHVPSGYFASLYSATNFQGVCNTVVGDVDDLATLDVGAGHVGSIAVGEPCPGTPAIRLFADASFAGRAVEVGNDVTDLASAGFDGAASSFRRVGSVPVALYSEPEYGGSCLDAAGDQGTLPEPMGDDRVSSIRIDHVCEPPAFTLAADARLRGAKRTANADVADVEPFGVPGVSSIAVLRGPLALYTEPRFGGDCLTLASTAQSLPASWNDRVRSVRVGASCDVGTRPAPLSTRFVTSSGRCLTSVGEGVEAEVLAKTCDGTPAQAFASRGEHLVDHRGRCLDLRPEAIARRGGQVVARPCVESRGQRFRRSTEGLRDLAGFCVEVAHAERDVEGGHVQVGPCDGESNQRLARVPVPAFGPVRIVAGPGASAEWLTVDGRSVRFAAAQAGSATTFEIVPGIAGGGSVSIRNFAGRGYLKAVGEALMLVDEGSAQRDRAGVSFDLRVSTQDPSRVVLTTTGSAPTVLVHPGRGQLRFAAAPAPTRNRAGALAPSRAEVAFEASAALRVETAMLPTEDFRLQLLTGTCMAVDGDAAARTLSASLCVADPAHTYRYDAAGHLVSRSGGMCVVPDDGDGIAALITRPCDDRPDATWLVVPRDVRGMQSAWTGVPTQHVGFELHNARDGRCVDLSGGRGTVRPCNGGNDQRLLLRPD